MNTKKILIWYVSIMWFSLSIFGIINGILIFISLNYITGFVCALFAFVLGLIGLLLFNEISKGETKNGIY